MSKRRKPRRTKEEIRSDFLHNTKGRGSAPSEASEGGGAANGFSTNLSLTTAVLKTGVNGSFFSTNAPYNVDSAAARSISYTLDAGTTVGKGFILLPYRLVAF